MYCRYLVRMGCGGPFEDVWVGVRGGTRERGAGLHGMFAGGWVGRMSCTGSLIRIGSILNVGTVLE